VEVKLVEGLAWLMVMNSAHLCLLNKKKGGFKIASVLNITLQ